jgi:hypothetical protein
LQDQHLEFDEEAVSAADAVEDEDDALRIIRGGVFRFEPTSLSNRLCADDSALRNKSILVDSSPALAQPYLLASRNFSPSDYLSTVHSSSTYPILASGLGNLQESIQQQSGALKQLVTGDFDRFVRCKNGIDEVYERMSEGGLNNRKEYGTLGVRKALERIFPLFEFLR